MSEQLERAASRPRIEDLERPELDNRQYRIITLPNKLEALLIHDPDTDKASAALDVNVGSFSDAEDMPGIAHAVEHLLFMGTEKYPQENAYNQYLNSHGGYSNAYTAATSTNYFFELAYRATPNSKAPSPNATQESLRIDKEDSPLWGALDRFGQFFICPLFLEDTVDREIKAVDSENKKNLQNDTWRLHQLSKALSNPDHPYNHFSTGSWKTLHDDPIARGVKIRDEFIKFHSTHYSANRMKLVVLGREDLDTLEQWVDEIFSQVPNKDLPKRRWDVPVYTEKELLTETFAKPVFESRSLELSFLYRDEEEMYESHPSRYLSHLIGHEGPGSILAYIKELGWATGLGAGGSTLCPGSGLFNISIKLTEEGLKNYREVTKIVFQYIAMMREQPPQQWVVDELMRMSEVSFRFKQKAPPSRTTSAVASVMQKPLDRKHLLSGVSVIKKFDPEAISEALSYLRPDNFRLKVVSQEFPGDWDQKEKWYGTEYRTGKLPEDFVAEIRAAFESPQRPKELHFPHKNEFIPQRLEVERKEVEEPLKTPKLIRNDEGFRTWYKKDDQFWVPKANVHIYFRTPLVHLTTRTAVLSALYRDLVQDALQEYTYDADISGLVYEFSNHTTGFNISVEGYNDKLHVLLEKVLVSIRDLEVREDRFKIIMDRTLRGLRNWEFTQPFHQVGSYSRWLKYEKRYMTDELLKELEGITADEVRKFYPLVLSQFHAEILVHGNMYKEEALQITDLVEKTMRPKRLALSQWPTRRNLILPPGSNYIYEKQLKDPANVNHCIEYSLYLGNASDRDLRAKILLIAQMTDEPAFNQLRTKEQLGYVVFSGAVISDNWAGYRILIQSEKDCRYLEGRIEHFLSMFEKTLAEMSEEELESHKRAVINKRLEKLKNLTEEGNRFWHHIFSDRYDFLLAEEDAKHIEPLTKQSLIDTFAHHISPDSPHRAKLSVHLIAQAKPKEPSTEEQKKQAIDSFSTILSAEGVEVDAAKLSARVNEATEAGSATEEAAVLISALETHIEKDLTVEQEKKGKILDEARAALGLAKVEKKLEHPATTTEVATEAVGEPQLSEADKKTEVPKPVLITDVDAWRAGLLMSQAVRPVRDLNEFAEDVAKL
ncbi:LuxS/MPP-like metallohydrolase [Westerdykella ornata]|uniref:LuxS/MPP-like metallohydrolase n=1 Tax=Westerdykella ornata TaxID=318751 RepID=A0A6A6JTJ9_WESOR|nr:LuxS/MPP-like metallohydrolase [Westerdykella ornata]KAF2279892.1 LuxS/MPP-like metallohydrolase [Westerdykella ornata]